MNLNFDLGKYLDSQQKDFLQILEKFNLMYGAIFWFFALLLYFTDGPIFFIISKFCMGSILIFYYIYPKKTINKDAFILLLMTVEIYLYALTSYEHNQASLFWLLLAPNYIFLLKGNKMKIAFLVFILGIIIITPFLNSVFNLRYESHLGTETSSFITILTAVLLLLLNYFIIQQYININQKDLSQLTDKNEELEIIKNDLIESRKFQEYFFANVSHELRTPLSTIIGVTDLIRKENINEDLIRCLKESSNSLSLLIDDFLEFNKIKEGDIEIVMKSFNLKENINKIASIFSFQFKEKNIVFDLNLNSKVPIHIIGDSKRLNQVLLNLIGNCIKFTENGSISLWIDAIELNEKNTQLQFVVSQTGSKMYSRKELLKLESITSKYSENIHSVLGLELTQKIISSQQGRLDIEKFPEIGFRYIVTLPFKIPPKNNVMSTLKNHNDPTIDNLNVLIVDDNKINLSITQKQLLLFNPNLNITTCESGLEALNQMEEKIFDVVLLDVRMPKISGIDVARKVRGVEGLNQQTPIIALTADVTPKTNQECEEAGINKVVSKPYDIKHLLLVINELTQENVS